MSARRKHPLFKNEKYKGRIARVNHIHTPNSLMERSFVASIIVFFCVFSDFYLLKVRWNAVQTENPLFIWCSALTCAVALDVPLSVAATAKRKYEQGLCSRQESNMTMYLSIVIFFVAYLTNCAFIWVTRSLVFKIGGGSTLVDNTVTAVVSQENQTMINVSAIYSTIMPLLTSWTSFIVSYFSSDPLSDWIRKYKKELIEIDNNLMDIEVALAETIDSPDKYREKEIAYENMRHKIELDRFDNDNQYMKQKTFEILAEMMSTPTQNGKIAKSAAENLYV